MHVFVSYNMGEGFSIGVWMEILWSTNGVGRTFSRSVLRKNMDAKFFSSVWPLNLLDIFVIYFPHYFTTYTLDYFAKRDSCLAYREKVFSELINLFKMSLQIHNIKFPQVYLWTFWCANKRSPFLQKRIFGFFFFFSKSCLKVGGAAYTRVRLIHEFLR